MYGTVFTPRRPSGDWRKKNPPPLPSFSCAKPPPSSSPSSPSVQNAAPFKKEEGILGRDDVDSRFLIPKKKSSVQCQRFALRFTQRNRYILERDSRFGILFLRWEASVRVEKCVKIMLQHVADDDGRFRIGAVSSSADRFYYWSATAAPAATVLPNFFGREETEHQLEKGAAISSFSCQGNAGAGSVSKRSPQKIEVGRGQGGEQIGRRTKYKRYNNHYGGREKGFTILKGKNSCSIKYCIWANQNSSIWKVVCFLKLANFIPFSGHKLLENSPEGFPRTFVKEPPPLICERNGRREKRSSAQRFPRRDGKKR